MLRKVLSWSVLCTLSMVSLSQCDRSPPEPVATASAKTKVKRCTVPTPEKAPAAVAPGPDPKCPEDPDGKPPEVPITRLRFPEASKAPVVQAETMLTEEHRSRGLMYRREMAEDHGMIFMFEDSQPRSFWMHNTCLPLDMLFIAEDGYITGILENVPTMNDDSRSNPCKARFVVEVNAGFCRKFGIKAGQTMKMER